MKPLCWIIVGCALATAIASSIHSYKRIALLEFELNTYVLLAAKNHARLNFERHDYRLWAAASDNDSSSQAKDTSIMQMPLSSKWDDLYIATYNETMKSALNQPSTNTSSQH